MAAGNLVRSATCAIHMQWDLNLTCVRVSIDTWKSTEWFWNQFRIIYAQWELALFCRNRTLPTKNKMNMKECKQYVIRYVDITSVNTLISLVASASASRIHSISLQSNHQPTQHSADTVGSIASCNVHLSR